MSSSSGDFPSAGLLAELEALRGELDVARRSARAWQIVLQASGLKDGFVVIDFAIEQGLVRSGSRESASWINPTDQSEMIWIPPGPCWLGDKPQVKALLPGFSLARHPVTNGQFQRFVTDTSYESHNSPQGWPDAFTQSQFLRHWSDGGLPAGMEDHPVVHVSYLDALAYCGWAGLTLPTEWAWEKAARGPEGRRYPWGEQSPEKLAQIRASGTCPVGRFPRTRTPYGCENLVGNVSEWCQMTPADRPDHVPAQAPIIPLPEAGETVYSAVRGSCFLRKEFWRMVSARRRRLSVTRRNRWVGFRPACLLPCWPAEGAA